MKFFHFFAVFFIALFSVSCSGCGCQEPDYEEIADKITAKTSQQLKKQMNLFLVGTGGRMMHDIQAMDMSFHYYQYVDIQQARKLLVHVIDEYLSEINNSNEIQPYLHDHPFTAKNVEIRIWICEPDGSAPPMGQVDYFSAIDGYLNFYLYGPDSILQETYEEAKKIVSGA